MACQKVGKVYIFLLFPKRQITKLLDYAAHERLHHVGEGRNQTVVLDSSCKSLCIEATEN